MSTLTPYILDPARVAVRAGTSLGITDRLEAEDDPTSAKIDMMVAENRARTPRYAAEMRRTPRLSISELNELDQEEIARRLSKIRRDDRTPVEQVIDLIDLPRNAVMQVVAPGLARRASLRGDTGTFGLGNVYVSDVLEEMGVENRIVRSVVGFAGDVLMDPLTYLGPAGWGAVLAGKGGSVALRRGGKRVLKAAIADAAAGRTVRDPSLAKYFAARGLTKRANETPAQAHVRIERAVRGSVDEGAIHKAFIPFGADRQYSGGTLVDDLFNPIRSEAGDAAAEFYARYGRGTRGIGPIGGSEIAHIPGTDISLRVRPFTREARRATETHRMARLRDSDITDAFIDDVRGGPIVAARHVIGTNADDALETQRAMHEESMQYEALIRAANRPPDPPSAGTAAHPAKPGGGPTPSAATPPTPAAAHATGQAATPSGPTRSDMDMAVNRLWSDWIEAAIGMKMSPELREMLTGHGFSPEFVDRIERGGRAFKSEFRAAKRAYEESLAAIPKAELDRIVDEAVDSGDETMLADIMSGDNAGRTFLDVEGAAWARLTKEERAQIIADDLARYNDQQAALKAEEEERLQLEDERSRRKDEVASAVAKVIDARPKVAMSGSVYMETEDGFKIRVSDHMQPPGGGFNVITGGRHGDADVDIVVTTGTADIPTQDELNRAISLAKEKKRKVTLWMHGRQAELQGRRGEDAEDVTGLVFQADTPPQPSASSERARVMREANEAFANIPEEDRTAGLAVLDAFINAEAKRNGVSPETLWAGIRFQRGTEGLSGLLQQSAWHGSPHLFEKFDINKVGTGTGHAAYGHGLYFSSSKDLAQWYRAKTSGVSVFVGGELVDDTNDVAKDLRFKATLWPDPIDDLRRSYKEDIYFAISRARNAEDDYWGAHYLQVERETRRKAEELEQMIQRGLELRPKGGALYHVDLAPKGDELLPWNDPVGENPALRSLKGDIGALYPTYTGQRVYATLEAMYGPRSASKRLLEAGIRGIAFRLMSARNYVIFDDADIAIKEILRQKSKGVFAQVMTPEGSRRVIAALESPDLSTLIHETGHLIRSFLSQPELEIVSRAYGIDPATWGKHIDIRRAAEERFAQDFERYFALGELPDIPGVDKNILASAFERIKQFILDLYKAIVGTPLEGKLHPDIKAVFDRALGVTTVSPAPKANPVVGRQASLHVPGVGSIQAQYAVVPASALIPSHDARRGFIRNVLGDLNERAYEDATEGAHLRRNVVNMADNPNPAFLHSDTPTATDGPPVVNESLVVLGGNARSMAQQLAYTNVRTAKIIRDAVMADAAKFGIDPSAITDISDPVIVRIVSNKDAGAPGELSRALNKSFTQARTADTDSVSRGRSIRQNDAAQIATIIGDGTLSDVFNDPVATNKLVKVLVESGAFDNSDIVQFMEPRGLLSQEGRRVVERTLAGAVVTDVRRLAETSPSTRQLVIRSIPALMRLRDVDPDFMTTFGHALDMLRDARESGAKTMAHLIEQPSILDQPWRNDRRAMALANAMFEEKPTVIADKLSRYAEARADAASGQGTLLAGIGSELSFDDLFPPLNLGPLYQRASRDVAGQGGLFGQGTYGAGGQQMSMFGEPTAKPASNVDPATDPFQGGVPVPERMSGETDAAYNKRLAEHAKWREATRNTGLLFQTAPGSGVSPIIEMEHSAFQQQSQERLRGLVQSARAAFERANDAMQSGRALAAVPTPANVRHELALQEAMIDAKVELDRAEAMLHQAEIARQLSGSLADMDDLVEQVALVGDKDVAEDLLYLFRDNPEFAEQYVELLQKGVATAAMQVDVLRGALSMALTRPETVLVERTKQLIGTGDAWIAASLFAPVARLLGKDGNEDSELVRTLWAIDRAFRSLGIRGGVMNRQLARIKALYRHAAMEGSRVEDAINRELAQVLSSVGKSDQLGAAAQLVYARMHTIRGQSENYYLWRFDPSGPVYDASGQIVNRSGLAELLHEAQQTGLLANDTVREAVDRIASEQINYLRSLGDAEVEDLVLGVRLAGYVPVTTTREFSDALRLQKEGYGPTGNIRATDRGKEPFQKGPRLTMQTRFADPDLLTRDGRPTWRRFFEGDRYLVEMTPEQIAETMARRYQGNDRAIAARTAEKLEAREAILRYDELAKSDPEFVRKYPSRPTDGIELNELFASGRFDYLTGSNPAPENFIETNAAMVMANRTMQHQRARAARLFKDILRESFVVDPVLLHNVAGTGTTGSGQVKRLANGRPFLVLAPQKSRVGGHVPTVLIDGERYRLLDSSVRADAADHPVLRGMFGGEQLDGRLFQHQFADAIEDLALSLKPDRMEQIVRLYDTFQSAWKMLTLTSPSWPIFNFVGNLTLAIMGGANPVTMARHALDAMRIIGRQANRDALADIAVTIRGQTITGDILLALARDRGVVNNTLSLEFAGAAAQADKSILQIPDRIMRRYLSPWFRANQMADDVVRLSAFISHLEDGADAATASSRVLRSMFDYADFTVIEERMFRRLFPFYSWMRSNLGYQVAMMLERPAYANLAPKLKVAIEEAAAGDDRVPENLRPSWMRESLATQIGSDPQSRFALMLGGNMLPQSDMLRILTPIFGVDGAMRFMHFVGSSLSPVIVKPAELAFGRELFSGREIGGDIGVGQFTGSLFRPLSEYGPVGVAAGVAGAAAGGMLAGTPGAIAGGLVGAQASLLAGGLGGRVGRSAEKSVPLAVSRSLIGGRVQAFDADRLDTSVAREIRDAESRLRGRIRAAEREGDSDASLRARTELMALYRDLVQRGLGDAVPKWAHQFLSRTVAQPIPIAN